MEIPIKLSKIRNLASFYLCLFMKIQRFSKATLKCDIVGKEDNYKYLVALYTYHFRERFTFSVFFFSCKSVFGQFTTRSSSFHSYSATSCQYDNVEVKEKSVMCHAS